MNLTVDKTHDPITLADIQRPRPEGTSSQLSRDAVHRGQQLSITVRNRLDALKADLHDQTAKLTDALDNSKPTAKILAKVSDLHAEMRQLLEQHAAIAEANSRLGRALHAAEASDPALDAWREENRAIAQAWSRIDVAAAKEFEVNATSEKRVTLAAQRKGSTPPTLNSDRRWQFIQAEREALARSVDAGRFKR